MQNGRAVRQKAAPTTEIINHNGKALTVIKGKKVVDRRRAIHARGRGQLPRKVRHRRRHHRALARGSRRCTIYDTSPSADYESWLLIEAESECAGEEGAA